MKAFLQNDNGLYYKANGEWTDDALNAMEFPTAEDAEQFCNLRHIPGVHPVLRFDPRLRARLSGRAPGMFEAGE